MLRAQDLRGRPLDVELFPAGSLAEGFEMLFALYPQTPLHWPVFCATDQPGDRVFDRATKRLLYGQAAVYRNAVGRVSLECARAWRSHKIVLRMRIAEDGWLVADIQDLDVEANAQGRAKVAFLGG